jgi:hypothetical protein
LVRPFSSDHDSRHLPLGLESLHHLLAVHAGWEAVAPRANVSGNRTIRGEKALRTACDVNRGMRRSRMTLVRVECRSSVHAVSMPSNGGAGHVRRSI